MSVQTLVLNGVLKTGVLVDSYGVTAPVLKRQVVSIPGANGSLDVTPNVAWEPREVWVRCGATNADLAREITRLNGQRVTLSCRPLWENKHWRGRLVIPKYAMWGSEHRWVMQIFAHPYLLDDVKKSKQVTASASGAEFTLDSSMATAIEVDATDQMTATFPLPDGGSATRSIPKGKSRLAGVVTPVTGKLTGTGSATFTWQDGELWNG